jgi:hypothetical protein
MKFYHRLKGLPFYIFVPLILAAFFVFALIWNLLGLNVGDNPLVKDYSLWQLIVFGSIAVPLLETMLLQMLPIELMLRIKTGRRKTLVASTIVLSSALFAATHWFNLRYVAYAFFMGLMLAFAYVVCKDKHGSGYAFTIVATIHALWNSFSTIEELLLLT